ncbi:MAG: choice-of-anchor D domain-containing protein, partial [Candidatus Krumholzibacteria bacterium]|nr:choice-of-anchor D domain-containing protein [Candidatus Krumholzibacteria bacterium]
YATSLSVGDILPLVAVSGTGGQPVSSCAVTPTALDFGSFLINNSRSREFVITNTGNQPLDIAPSTVSPGYSVSGSPRRLNAGQAATYTVTLTPPGEGVWDGVITTGEALCPEVFCTGTGNYPDVAGNDLVGIFFDPGFSLNEIDLPVYRLHTAYVVLFNPTGGGAVSGWECAIELVGRVNALDWTLAGNGVNGGVGTDFRVSLASPLPLAPTVELARFQIMVLYPYGTILMLMNPATNPTIAGEMSWLPYGGPAIAMQSYTGDEIVALVNEGRPVAVQAPTPSLTLAGAQVRLEWTLAEAPDTGCHVYRRADGEVEQRLTNQPLAAGTGTFTYTDEPVGFAPGTQLHYSYALVMDGRETARSPEVDVDVGALPTSRTRLLPNVPNPFNPRTEIRFELAAPAQVTLVVFDLSGRVVRTLIAGDSLPAASHVREWRGEDDGGRTVASGVYFYRLEAGGFGETRRMVLMK